MSYRVVISYGGRERLIGRVVDKTLICNRTESKHLFRGGRSSVAAAKKDGTASWGLDCKVCDGLLSRGVEWIEIVTGTKIYKSKLADIRDKGRVLHIKPHRAQYFLNLKEFQVRGVE